MTDQDEEVAFAAYRYLPEIAAVYAVWAGEVCLYVGQTRNLNKRWAAHHISIACAIEGADAISWIPVPVIHLRQVERTTIEKFKPLLNRGGELWRKPYDKPSRGWTSYIESC